MVTEDVVKVILKSKTNGKTKKNQPFFELKMQIFKDAITESELSSIRNKIM